MHRRLVADYGGVSWPQGADRVLRLVRDVEAKLAILFGGAAGNVTPDLPGEMFETMAELADIVPSLAQ